MFTGLIESVCRVSTVGPSSTAGTALAVDLGPLSHEAKIGDSIAVNGACLTVTRLTGTVASFDVSQETLRRSTLGALRPSSKVNVERALRLGDRFGGHVVQGHVDGTGAVGAIRRQDAFIEVSFVAGQNLLEQMVIKGSVAVEGVSLTIAGLDKTGFSVAIIPQTAAATTLGSARVGDTVNIETDLIVKAVRRYLEQIVPRRSDLTVNELLAMGF